MPREIIEGEVERGGENWSTICLDHFETASVLMLVYRLLCLPVAAAMTTCSCRLL